MAAPTRSMTFAALLVLGAFGFVGCATGAEPSHPVNRSSAAPPVSPPSSGGRADGAMEDAGVPHADDGPPEVPPPPAPPDPPPASPPPAPPPASPPPSLRRPVVLVHGINGSPADFATMIDRLVADGWPREWIVAVAYSDPSWGCNVDNAIELADAVDSLRRATGAPYVDIVAHSMGNLGARHFVKQLGGTDVVARYVGLGGMHQGLFTPCLSPLPVCVWQELCETGELIQSLNAVPAAPGPVSWLSIAGGADETVPPGRARLDGAVNVVVEGVTHVGLLTDGYTYELVRDSLLAPRGDGLR